MTQRAATIESLPMAFAPVAVCTGVQRCWAHKIRNVLDKVRKADHDTFKTSLHDVMNAATRSKARSAARRSADRWESLYPKRVMEGFRAEVQGR